jgi:hypothetical protein
MPIRTVAAQGRVSLFAGLTDEQLAHLNDLCTRDDAEGVRSYSLGQHIVRQGEQGEEFFVSAAAAAAAAAAPQRPLKALGMSVSQRRSNRRWAQRSKRRWGGARRADAGRGALDRCSSRAPRRRAWRAWGW